MKGFVFAGGLDSPLYSLIKVTNRHLLPVLLDEKRRLIYLSAFILFLTLINQRL